MRSAFTICGIAAPIAVALAFASGEAKAYCVYNKTNDTTAQFYQQVPPRHLGVLGKSYQNRLSAGKNGCCNWRNKDCNPDGKQDSEVAFQVHVENFRVDCFKGSYDGVHGNKQEFPKIEAGGWLELVNNSSFDRSKKKYGSDNPPYMVLTFRTNGQSMGSYPCPGYAADKPGLMDFL